MVWKPTHTHRKGGEYRLISNVAWLEATMQPVAIYDDEDGVAWVRPINEFYDGRFTAIPGSPNLQGTS